VGIQHRYELSHECTQRRNKLTSICDELFPEFTTIFRDPNLLSALAFREKFPTPHAIATASVSALKEVRLKTFPSEAQLLRLHQLATHTIGTKEVERQRSLVLEQALLIKKLRLIQEHLAKEWEFTSLTTCIFK